MQAGYQLKIADLGLATFSGESTENTRLTSEGAAIGSPHYMSPEQTLGQPDLDFRTDVYALGITIYHALTGVTPYAAPSVAAVLARKLSEPMADPREIRPELPPAVALLLQKMTAPICSTRRARASRCATIRLPRCARVDSVRRRGRRWAAHRRASNRFRA
jgi:serine/threonine-protein kinase